MSVDIWLIIVVCVIAVLLIVANVYALVYFQHPDDKNTAWMPKILVILGFFFAEAAILMFPLDVANQAGAVGCAEGWNPACGGLDMETMWYIVFICIIVSVIVLIPFAIYYYEADDGDDTPVIKKLIQAFQYEFATVVVAILVLLISFQYLSTTNIPLKIISGFANGTFPDVAVGESDTASDFYLSEEMIDKAASLSMTSTVLDMKVTFTVYAIALMSFFGWFVFIFFGGIGMVALPIDLIMAFVYRPKFMPADIYAEQKQRTQEIIEIGELMKQDRKKWNQEKHSRLETRRRKELDRITMNKFKQMVFLMEKDYDELRECHLEYKNHNPLIPFAKLLLGIISLLVSIIWVVHIGIYLLPGRFSLHPFLNTYFMWFDQWFPLFGTISVGIFTLYLLAAVVAGCFKFGMRCFCCSLHPMKFNGTYMNSFLFNLVLILLAVIPVVQFAAQAFQEYARLTNIYNIFGSQVRYLRFFSIFFNYNIFIYIFVAIILLTVMYLTAAPSDRPVTVHEMRESMKKRSLMDA